MDLRVNATKELQNVSGILVSGDIAFSGVKATFEVNFGVLEKIGGKNGEG